MFLYPGFKGLIFKIQEKGKQRKTERLNILFKEGKSLNIFSYLYTYSHTNLYITYSANLTLGIEGSPGRAPNTRWIVSPGPPEGSQLAQNYVNTKDKSSGALPAKWYSSVNLDVQIHFSFLNIF